METGRFSFRSHPPRFGGAGLVAVGALVLTACSSISGEYPRGGAVIPDAALRVSPTKTLALEKIAATAAGAALLYAVYDPLAPNWSIEEKLLDADTYYISMRAKSFRTGGDGEAMQILKRRGLQLQRERGFPAYRILDYSEGVSSSTPFTNRYSEGTIQLVRSETSPRP